MSEWQFKCGVPEKEASQAKEPHINKIRDTIETPQILHIPG